MKEAFMRMSEAEFTMVAFIGIAAFVGLIFLIQNVIKSARKSNKGFASIWSKITSETGLTVLGWVLTLVGVVGIIAGVGLMMNSAEALGMPESKYGLILAVSLFGGVFAGVFGIAILGRHRPSKAPKSTQAFNSKLNHMQTMPSQFQADYLNKATTEYIADVRNEIQAEKTKKGIIKGAVIGGVVGGDAGAVVGAMVGKENSSDSTTGKATASSMVKGAVIGGAIAGKAGAVVGAMVGKEKAKNKQ